MVSALPPSDDGSSSSSSSSSSSKPPRPRKRKTNPPTQKRLAANRANALKSSGPRTAAGKARSRFNALRHGLCARVILLPGEDRAEFEAFAEEFIADLEPVGVVQEMLAARVAGLAWALTRLPETAGEIVEHGERRRFELWFNRRGLKDKYYAKFASEAAAGKDAPFGRAERGAIADAELAKAAAEGSSPPDERNAAGILADALADDDAFDAMLKLEEHERRLWSALLATLRSLERRQKVMRSRERCAEEAADAPQTVEEPRRASPVAQAPPAFAGRREKESSSPSPSSSPDALPQTPPLLAGAGPSGAERATTASPAAPPAHPPARNEPISPASSDSQPPIPSNVAEPPPRAADAGVSCKGPRSG